jgi:hypothetical protein
VLVSFNWQVALIGLQLRILNGVVSLLTTQVENKRLAAYVSEQSGASRNLQMTTATLARARSAPFTLVVRAAPCRLVLKDLEK